MSERALPWLLAYDVRCRKRLARLHRRLRREAAPVQYSVFLLYATTARVEALMDELAAGWIAAEDDLRAYPLDAGGAVALGRPRCPEGWTGWQQLLARGEMSGADRRFPQGLAQAPDPAVENDPEQFERMPRR